MNTTSFLFKTLPSKRYLSLNFSSSYSSWSPKKNIRECVTLLQQCANRKSLRNGRQVHSYVLVNGFLDSPSTVTSLVNMYSKCGRTSDAVSVFGYLSNDGDRNVFCYNAMISGFTSNGRALQALDFYKKMREFGVLPDKFTFPCVIRACCDLMEVSEVRRIHGLLFKLGLELDVFVGSALVNACLKLGIMEDAQRVFDEMAERDVVLWNSMVNGYAQMGRVDEALGVFRTMSEEGVVPSSFTVTGVLSIFALNGDLNNGRSVHGLAAKMGYDLVIEVSNALIDVYGKCKCPGDALEIFEAMDEKDDFSWNSIISVHEQFGDYVTALKLFERMLGAMVRPDLVTITTFLPVCSHLVALMHGREIHGYMIRNSLGLGGGDEDVMVNNALMDMYMKCGYVRNAHTIFCSMSNKHVASWNIMIMGHGMHGHADEALRMFSQMCEENFKPNDVTFIGVLSACDHVGLLDQGREILSRMETEHGVVPSIEHYTCVVNMLGRAGKLEEAHKIIQTMPIEANPVIWRAILAACRLYGDKDLAEIAAEKVIELEPEHCGSYVLMSNIYLEAGQFEEVSKVRHSMRQQNLKKVPGCSWIELKDGVHAFITADRDHPDANLIYGQLVSLTARLREHGYVPHV